MVWLFLCIIVQPYWVKTIVDYGMCLKGLITATFGTNLLYMQLRLRYFYLLMTMLSLNCIAFHDIVLQFMHVLELTYRGDLFCVAIPPEIFISCHCICELVGQIGNLTTYVLVNYSLIPPPTHLLHSVRIYVCQMSVNICLRMGSTWGSTWGEYICVCTIIR